MAYDITVKHPDYCEFDEAWRLMRDSFDGEDRIKDARISGMSGYPGEQYLPMKSGTRAIKNLTVQEATYKAYKMRAEFPELVAPTVRGASGLLLKKPSTIDLPPGMEFLRERATQDGLGLDELHRRIVVEAMLMGRYGLLPGIGADGNPYIAGYIAESIINWDSVDGQTNFIVLDECTQQRDPETGKWGEVEQYRELSLTDAGQFYSRMWTKNANGEWMPGEEVFAQTRQGDGLNLIPFVFIGTNDLSEKPDDVPLYGLARLAVRIYRLDADYVHALHMTSEPTPVVTGFPDPKTAKEDGSAPTSIGSSTLWVLPPGSEAKFLEFTGAGIQAQERAIAAALQRAVAAGAQILTDTQRTAESGEAIRLRLGNQASLLHMIALNSAAGLERALRNIAVWLGENPDSVKVTPNLEFFSEPLTALDLNALVAGWQSGAYSYTTMFDRFKRGGLIPEERTEEQEHELMLNDQFRADMSNSPPAVSGRSSASLTSPLGAPDGP